MGKDEKLEAYRLEHEQYLSEFRIILTTALTIMFGIVIAIATDNIKIGDTTLKTILLYFIFIYGTVIILLLRRRYDKILRNIREDMKFGGKYVN